MGGGENYICFSASGLNQHYTGQYLLRDQECGFRIYDLRETHARKCNEGEKTLTASKKETEKWSHPQ